jgi:hypothetical protein
MTNNAKLISYIEVFYSEIIEEYKEITLGIRSDATPMSIFKKKNYQQHIDRLRACKKDVLRINPRDIKIEQADKLGHELKASFENALQLFVGLCDLQIQVQVALQNTANKKGTKFSECKDATNRLNAHNKDAQRAFHQLDVLYADYLD